LIFISTFQIKRNKKNLLKWYVQFVIRVVIIKRRVSKKEFKKEDIKPMKKEVVKDKPIEKKKIIKQEKKKEPIKEKKSFEEIIKTLKEEMKELSIEIFDSDSDSIKSKNSSKGSVKQINSEMYIYQDEKSNKFWRIEYIPNEDGEYRIEYGRMGKPGKIESKNDTWVKIKKLIDSKNQEGLCIGLRKKKQIVLIYTYKKMNYL